MFDVLLSFFIPVFRIFIRINISAVVPVPKATICKYGYTLIKENKIRVANDH